jgi:hypothetical protein
MQGITWFHLKVMNDESLFHHKYLTFLHQYIFQMQTLANIEIIV